MISAWLVIFLGLSAVVAGGDEIGALHFPAPCMQLPLINSDDHFVDLAVGDLNGDGLVDLAVAGGWELDFVPLYSQGDGRFVVGPALDDGSFGGRSLALGDFDADGRLDVVVDGWNYWTVLLNLGDGSFAETIVYEAGVGDGRSTHAVDMNGDGNVDIVSLALDPDAIVVVPGNGDGSFGPCVTQAVDPGAYWRALVGDCDRDGFLDVVTLGPAGVAVWPGTGDGGFGVPSRLSIAGGAYRAAILDANEDDVPDLVVSTPSGLMTLLGTGDGSFDAGTPFGVEGFPTAGDVDRDGMTDLVVYGTYQARVATVYSGDGAGGFVQEAVYSVTDSGPGVLHDFDGDGRLDSANVGSFSVSVLIGGEEGPFLQAYDEKAIAHAPADVMVEDVTGDGLQDVIIVDDSADELAVLAGHGDGNFVPVAAFSVGTEPIRLESADIDGNGIADFVTANRMSADVSVLLGTGSGVQPAQSYPVGVAPTDLAVADVDGDGYADAVIGGLGMHVLWGDASGSLSPAQDVNGGVDVHSVAVADMNQDGDADLVGVGGDDQSLMIVFNEGARVFSTPVVDDSLGVWRESALDVGDLNGDAIPDVVITDDYCGIYGCSGVSVSLGVGDGSFLPRTKYMADIDGPATWVEITDVNDDRVPDILFADVSGRDALSVLLGQGDGTFGEWQLLMTGQPGGRAAVADVTGDDRQDVVFVGGGATLTVIAQRDVGRWCDLGNGLGGTHGVPRLTGSGILLGAYPVSATLSRALENATAWFVVGVSELNLPFEGGVLVPDPDPGLVLPLPVNASGTLQASGSWPPGVPAGLALYLQVWVEDPGGPFGYAASNALSAIAP